MNIGFSFDNALFNDNSSDLLLTLRGSGSAAVAMETDDTEALSTLISSAVESAIEGMKTVCDRYEEIPYNADRLLDMARVVLRTAGENYADALESLTITAIYPDDESMPLLAQARKQRREADGSAEAVAVEQAEDIPAAESSPTSESAAESGDAAQGNGIEAYIRANFDASTKVKAVSYYRQQTGVGLAEAKAAVERILS